MNDNPSNTQPPAQPPAEQPSQSVEPSAQPPEDKKMWIWLGVGIVVVALALAVMWMMSRGSQTDSEVESVVTPVITPDVTVGTPIPAETNEGEGSDVESLEAELDELNLNDLDSELDALEEDASLVP